MTRKLKKVGKLLLGVILLVFVIGYITLYFYANSESDGFQEFEADSYMAFPTDIYEITAIEGNANITIPPSAHDIYSYTSGFRDIFTMVRFSMNPNDLPPFLQSTLCSQSLSPINPPIQLESAAYPSWWLLHKADLLKKCSGENDHSHQTIQIDMTDPANYIVYVSTSTY